MLAAIITEESETGVSESAPGVHFDWIHKFNFLKQFNRDTLCPIIYEIMKHKTKPQDKSWNYYH